MKERIFIATQITDKIHPLYFAHRRTVILGGYWNIKEAEDDEGERYG